MEVNTETMQKSKFGRICVFCGSSQGKKTSYHDAAVDLGNELVLLLHTSLDFLCVFITAFVLWFLVLTVYVHQMFVNMFVGAFLQNAEHFLCFLLSKRS